MLENMRFALLCEVGFGIIMLFRKTAPKTYGGGFPGRGDKARGYGRVLYLRNGGHGA